MTTLRRIPGLLVALLLATLAAPATGRDPLVGRVVVGADGSVRVGQTPVPAALSEGLRPLVGREVEVDLAAERVLRPARTEVRGSLDDDGLLVVAGERRRLTLSGAAAGLVPRGRAVILDVWRLEGDEAVVVAVEGRTTGDWNLVHAHPRWPSPSSLIRGRKPIWVLARADGRVLVQRGDTRGWVDRASVVLGEAPSAGLIDGLPR